MPKIPEIISHWRIRCAGLRYWAAGKEGCCGVWYYSNPVRAMVVSRRRHKNRIRLGALRDSDLRALNGRVSIDVKPRYRTVREGQPWREKMPTGPMTINGS